MPVLKRDQSGFTIIELMIATLVFSVILLVATYGILNVGRLYRKSLTSNQTQQAARSILDTVSQNIKFNSGVFYDNTNMYCLGSNTRISSVVDQQVTGSNHAAVVDTINCSMDTVTKDLSAALSSGDKELLGPKMRLAKFSICYEGVDTTAHPDCEGISINQSDLYYITVRVIYGDSDLLTSDHQNCLLTAGREFCAVASLSTYVQKVL